MKDFFNNTRGEIATIITIGSLIIIGIGTIVSAVVMNQNEPLTTGTRASEEKYYGKAGESGGCYSTAPLPDKDYYIACDSRLSCTNQDYGVGHEFCCKMVTGRTLYKDYCDNEEFLVNFGCQGGIMYDDKDGVYDECIFLSPYTNIPEDTPDDKQDNDNDDNDDGGDDDDGDSEKCGRYCGTDGYYWESCEGKNYDTKTDDKCTQDGNKCPSGQVACTDVNKSHCKDNWCGNGETPGCCLSDNSSNSPPPSSSSSPSPSPSPPPPSSSPSCPSGQVTCTNDDKLKCEKETCTNGCCEKKTCEDGQIFCSDTNKDNCVNDICTNGCCFEKPKYEVHEDTGNEYETECGYTGPNWCPLSPDNPHDPSRCTIPSDNGWVPKSSYNDPSKLLAQGIEGPTPTFGVEEISCGEYEKLINKTVQGWIREPEEGETEEQIQLTIESRCVEHDDCIPTPVVYDDKAKIEEIVGPKEMETACNYRGPNWCQPGTTCETLWLDLEKDYNYEGALKHHSSVVCDGQQKLKNTILKIKEGYANMQDLKANKKKIQLEIKSECVEDTTCPKPPPLKVKTSITLRLRTLALINEEVDYGQWSLGNDLTTVFKNDSGSAVTKHPSMKIVEKSDALKAYQVTLTLDYITGGTYSIHAQHLNTNGVEFGNITLQPGDSLNCISGNKTECGDLNKWKTEDYLFLLGDADADADIDKEDGDIIFNYIETDIEGYMNDERYEMYKADLNKDRKINGEDLAIWTESMRHIEQ